VCDEVSFTNLEEWLKRIEENVDSSVEVIILGNKIDLVNDRVVTEE
jgi:GTPase SAR1 family protein